MDPAAQAEEYAVWQATRQRAEAELGLATPAAGLAFKLPRAASVADSSEAPNSNVAELGIAAISNGPSKHAAEAVRFDSAETPKAAETVEISITDE